MTRQKIKYISGFVCMFLGVGVFVIILLGVFYNVIARTFNGEAIMSIILYIILGLTLLVTGTHLIKTKPKEVK